jgi:hypothetical protein
MDPSPRLRRISRLQKALRLKHKGTLAYYKGTLVSSKEHQKPFIAD